MAFQLTTVEDPPSAHLVFASSDLPTGTRTISVYRSYDGLTSSVLGASNVFASGGAVVDDWAMPTGTDVTYFAETFDVAGAPLGRTSSATARVEGHVSKAWFSDPSNPALSVRVDLKRDFAETQKRVRQVQTYQVGNRVVALLGARGGLENVNIRVQTETIEDGNMLGRVLGQTSVLIRTVPPADVPRLLYVVVPEVQKSGTGSLADIQFGGGRALWSAEGTEISPNTLDILVPVVTWQTYIEAFPGATWADVEAFYTGTWLDAKKNPPGV